MKKINYTPQRIPICWGDKDHRVTISVFAQVASNGLAYYRWLNKRGKNGRYGIVHVVSGLSVIPKGLRLQNPKQCKKLIVALDPVANWHQSEKIVCQTAHFALLHDALSQAGYQFPW
jgi:hypothetical protein